MGCLHGVMFLRELSQSMPNVVCDHHDEMTEGCRDAEYALILKVVAIAAILTAGVCGVIIPLVGKKRRFFQTDSNLFFTAKAFAAGVILATGFVHMLPDATAALTNPCLPTFPWSKFPFPGFIAMMAALATLLADFMGTHYYASKQQKQSQIVPSDALDAVSGSRIVPVETRGLNWKVFGEEEGGVIHIVGMHAHAAHHRHSHSQEQVACAGQITEQSLGHSHSHGIGSGEEEKGDIRHTVISQRKDMNRLMNKKIFGFLEEGWNFEEIFVSVHLFC